MENTFDINTFDKERLKTPATYRQCKGLSFKFAKNQKTGVMDWRYQKQVLGCLFGEAKNTKLSFKQANDLFSKNKLPKKYGDMIESYLKENS